jgi:flap endonuclease-1
VGVVLTPIIHRQPIALDDLRGKVLAVDGNGELYQFLALIRLPDGMPLRDQSGRVTSHLSGLFFRTTRLIADYALQLAFVFDGVPPPRKSGTLAKRRAVKAQFEREHEEARARGDLAEAYAKATMTSRLTREMVGEARELLRLLGLPTLQAPAEGEAQAACMAQKPGVWAAASKDYDTLLFGAPRLVRFLTISGKEFLPSRGAFRPIAPEVIELQRQLDTWAITSTQLVDLAILVGTDFNPGVKGIGPKKALRLVQTFGRIEDMPDEIRERVGDISEIREIYLRPATTDDYQIEFRPPDRGGIISFLCDERQFSRERVTTALDRAFPDTGEADRSQPRLF